MQRYVGYSGFLRMAGVSVVGGPLFGRIEIFLRGLSRISVVRSSSSGIRVLLVKWWCRLGWKKGKSGLGKGLEFHG